VKKASWLISLALCTVAVTVPLASDARSGASGDIAMDTYPDAQAQVKKRLQEIWATASARDFARLESFHLYGPKFTEFKDGAPRGDAAANKKEEKEVIGMLVDPKVEMKDLAINVYGDTAIATFNGDFAAKIDGKPVAEKQQSTMIFVKYRGDWKIVHEHFSPIGPPPGGAPGK
jgi:ketosteroid isomerase-like protein